MEKKSILIVLIIVILLLIIGFLSVNNLQLFKQEISVGSVNFTLPNGYHEGTANSNGDLNITDGNNTIFLTYSEGTDINNLVNSYIGNSQRDNNFTIEASNMTMNDIKIYKAFNKNTSAAHYWFEYNDKVYSIYTWNKIGNMDAIVFDLIESMKN